MINLFGGPGVGKSTLAAKLFHDLGLRGFSCEIVREYVKEWAWNKSKIGPFDQFYIAAKQSKLESSLYNKVEVLITDSPTLLGCFYEEFNHGNSIALPAVKLLMKRAEGHGMTYHNYIIERTLAYNQAGRYESENIALQLDQQLINFIKREGIEATPITFENHDKVTERIVDELIARQGPT